MSCRDVCVDLFSGEQHDFLCKLSASTAPWPDMCERGPVPSVPPLLSISFPFLRSSPGLTFPLPLFPVPSLPPLLSLPLFYPPLPFVLHYTITRM